MLHPIRSSFVFVALGSVALAQSGCPDFGGEFGLPGFRGSVREMATYDDGSGARLIFGGTFATALQVPAPCIAAYDGTSFSSLAGGVSGGTTLFGLSVDALGVLDAGNGARLYAGGRFQFAGSTFSRHVAMWNPTTSAWEWMGGVWGGESVVLDLETFDDGTGPALFVGGSFDSVATMPAPNLARWNGFGWQPVGGGVSSPSSGATAFVLALETFDDGSGPALYVAGSFERAGGIVHPNIARWDGSTWSSVGGGIGGTVFDLEVFDDGSGPALYAAGVLSSAGGASVSNLARWNGSAWSSVGSISGTPRSLATYDDGTGTALYVAGSLVSAAGVPVDRLARWNGVQWSAVPGASFAVDETSGFVDLEALHVFDAGNGPKLYVGGTFDVAAGMRASNVAIYGPGGWSRFGSAGGTNGAIHALAEFDRGAGAELYAGGSFTRAGDVTTRGLARWNGDAWEACAGEGILGSSVEALITWDDGSGNALYAGGWFGAVDTTGAIGVARFDGTSWQPVGAGFSGSFASVFGFGTFDDGGGRKLYAGGQFTSSGGVPMKGIARWDGTSWSAVPGADFQYVYSLAEFDSGNGAELYVGGLSNVFIDGQGVVGIYRFDGTSWHAVGTGLGPQVSYPLARAMLSFDDGSGPALYVGGSFTVAGSVAATHIARWDGVSWSTLDAGLSSGVVHALAAYDDGSGQGLQLYAAGEFGSSGSTSMGRIGRWNGAQWSAVSNTDIPGVFPGLDGAARALVVHDDVNGAKPSLFVGGAFERADGVSSEGLAVWRGCAEEGRLYCFGDGTSGACPCGNQSSPAERAGCAHSFGIGGALRASGVASLGNDTLVLAGSQMTNSTALYVHAAKTDVPVFFGDGLKCIRGPFVRLGSKVNVAGGSSYPGAGDLPLSVKGGVLTPGKRAYQVRYRNAASFCTSETFNYANGVEITWGL